MFLEESPITRQENNYWKEKIIKKFPSLKNISNSKFLSLKEYLIEYPQKFYCEQSFHVYYNHLETAKLEKPNTLVRLLNEYEHEIDLALKKINEINQLKIHDIIIPDDNKIYTIQFIENNIHFNFLKLIESTYTIFLKILASYQRIYKNKSTSGLDTFNCVQELKNTELKPLTNFYNNTIRNGIAHGKVKYLEHSIIYQDKRGNKEEIRTKQIVKKFDSLVDICNSMTLAFKIFIIINREFLASKKYTLPSNYLLQELAALANTPFWKISDCLENTMINNQKQLNIFIKNYAHRHRDVNYYSLRTAILAEYFAPDYHRYFLSLKSKHSNLVGFGGYDGKVLKENRLKNSNNAFDYKNVIVNNLLFFAPKNKIFSHLIQSIKNYTVFLKLKSSWVDFHEKTNYKFKRNFEIRFYKYHRRNKSIVISDTRVLVKNSSRDEENIIYIRKNFKKIINYTSLKSKIKLNKLYGRFLKTEYIRVMVHEKDFRIRDLKDSGLIDSLVCTISVNNSKTIKTIDILNGKVEQYGRYRIVWNNNWKGIRCIS
ncbi:hypothetical protein [Tenacibaculum sp. IB213877]|uniref:hypothetical protein n=1 Tax=Tenacibaculum sp. IB213877 TaxID=3097351 RepID=UPI002A59DA06|nr:hypothetical protein [Tenacibaculum sp. IB213877]MDY0780678.1 hypothetical protein [Tenacibaculum sp. IB213877]